jgi:hypothetical protein
VLIEESDMVPCGMLDGLASSLGGWTGSRVFLTTTGGTERPRELNDDSGLIFCGLSGREYNEEAPLDGALATGLEEVSDAIEPFDTKLNRLAD